MSLPAPRRQLLRDHKIVPIAFAFTAYKPNCSETPNNVNYLSPPQYRGTLDIIWSCFAVVLTCTWAVQHLSVPIPAAEAPSSTSDELRRPTSSLHRVKQVLRRLRTPEVAFLARKFRWMLLSVAAPEFVLGKALAERWAAQESERQSDIDGWTTMHAFFANMRGFILRFNVNAVKMPLTPSKPDELGRSLHKLRPGPFADGEAPYYEQDIHRAELIESIHSHKIIGDDKEEKLDDVDEGGATPLDTTLKPQTQNEDVISEQHDHLPMQEASTGIRSTLQRTTPDISLSVFTSHSLPRRHTAEPLTLATPTTLVNSPRSPRYSPALSGTSPSSQHRVDFAQTHSVAVSPATPKGPSKLPASTASQKGIPRNHPTWRASWPLNSMQIQYAQQQGIIPRAAFVAHEALKDRSKGDSFIKGFAILQITALVVQIIARSFQNLATTLLEVNVLAFAACAIVTYILLWHKPQDVKVPIYIDIPTILTRDQIIKLAARAPVATLVINDYWLHGVSIRAQSDNVFPWTPGIRLKLPFNSDPILVSPIIFGIGGGGLIFGAIHFSAWNFHFPTPVERLLWRMSCTVLIVFPMIGTAFYWTMQRFAAKLGAEDTKVNRAIRPMSWIIGLVYLSARGYLVVEVFRALAYPEPSIFQQVNWPSLIPYLD
ncbi:MAG: hypothetical protein Q9218_001183 [Villophora microphyllina]